MHLSLLHPPRHGEAQDVSGTWNKQNRTPKTQRHVSRLCEMAEHLKTLISTVCK